MKDSSFNPDWCSPPGESIKDCLRHHGFSDENFAEKLQITTKQVKELFEGKIAIDKSLASKLSFWLGSTPQFWLKREENYCKHPKSIKLGSKDD